MMSEFLKYLGVLTVILFVYWGIEFRIPEVKAYALGFLFYMMYAYGKYVGKEKV